MQIKMFTGGVFDTNCFLISEGAGTILIDAPQESAEWLSTQETKVDLLLLTHGHIDHIFDAAKIQREHSCEIGCHQDTVRMISEPDFFRQFGFQLQVEPARADLLIEESPSLTLAGIPFEVLLVPGHCPGSLCFLSREKKTLFGGDVLFAGGIGRWDLPGGDHDLLLHGIRTKLLPLDDDTRVLPGHGPATTIGAERSTNPFLI